MPWTNTGQSLKGPKGDTGSQGPAGAQGNPGATGPGVASGGAAGQILRKISGANYDTEWVPQAGVIVARNTKSSGTIAVTTVEKPVLSVIAPVVAGRSYLVTARVEIDATAPPMTSQASLRHTTNNTEPTITSAILSRSLTDHRATSVPDSVEVTGRYDAAASGTLRVLLSVLRAVGTGQNTVRADGTPIHIWVEDVGPTVSATGTAYT